MTSKDRLSPSLLDQLELHEIWLVSYARLAGADFGGACVEPLDGGKVAAG